MEIIKTEDLFTVEERYITEEGKKKKGFLKIKRLFLRNKGKDFTRDKVVSPDAVCAVVYDEVEHKYIFAKQYRPGPQKDVIELAAGLIDHKGISPMDTMIAEVEQELGYKVDHIIPICTPFFTTPGKTNEKMYLFYVTVSEQISKGGGLETENEDIEVIKVYEKDIEKLGIEDGKTLVGLYRMNLLKHELL
jgi:ADP-ribose pyrophosphatase